METTMCERFSDGGGPRPSWWFWAVLAVLFVAIRLVIAGYGHPAFQSDEAVDYEYALMAGQEDLEKDFVVSYRPMVGLRLWLTRLVNATIPGPFPIQPVCAGALLSMAASSFWVAFVYRRLSRWAGILMACALVFAPAATLYYSTMINERRVETILVGGLMALGAGKWLSNAGWALGLGILTAWGFFSEPFILFFLLPVLWHEGQSRGWKFETSLWKLGAFALAGIVLGGEVAFFSEQQWPSFPKNYLQWGWASLLRLSKNGYMILHVFPQYWMGNFPFGFLQNTPLGNSCDPVWGHPWSNLLGLMTVLTFAFSLWGYNRSEKEARRNRPFLMMLAVPAFCLLLFFLFSHQTWSFPALRYLNFWMIFWAAGFGLGGAWLMKRTPRAACVFAATWLLVHGGVLGLKWWRMNGDRPGAIIARELERLDLRVGYAHFWVSEVVRRESGNRVKLLAENNDIIRRSVFEEVWSSPKMVLVDVGGLDDPEAIRSATRQLVHQGYRPIRQYRFEHDWSAIEFLKVVPGGDTKR